MSFTFGCPDRSVIAGLQRAGSRVVVTVTTPDEALTMAAAGADAVGAQGIEAGGHQGTFDDHRPLDGGWGLDDLLDAVTEEVGIPAIAAGGLADGSDVARVIAAGAIGAQLGTALLRSHRERRTPDLQDGAGRPGLRRRYCADLRLQRSRACGLVNTFMRDQRTRPSAYPQINNATRFPSAPGGGARGRRGHQPVGRAGLPIGRGPPGRARSSPPSDGVVWRS